MKEIEKWVKDKTLYTKKQYVETILKNSGIDFVTGVMGYGSKDNYTFNISIFTYKGCLHLTFPFCNKDKYIVDLEDMIVRKFKYLTPIQIITKELIEEYNFIKSLPKPKKLTKPVVHRLYLTFKPIQYENKWGYDIDFYK